MFERLNHFAKSNNESYKSIAKRLIQSTSNNEKINNISTLSKESNVSMSTMSRFVREMNFPNFNVFMFDFNNMIQNWEGPTKSDVPSLSKVADMMNKSNRIFYIGVSNSYYLLRDFSLKLMRLNKSAFITENPDDQKTLLKLAKKGDVIFVISISGVFAKSMIDDIKTEADIILLTAQDYSNRSNINVINIDSKNFNEKDNSKIYSQLLMETHITLDILYNEMLDDPKNKATLEKTLIR